MTRKIYYSDDVNILDHATNVVFLQDGVKHAINIERDENIEQYCVYITELYNKPSDSWINEDDLIYINDSCDSSYDFNAELSEYEQYLFTSDLCWYYGANNFDSCPLHFISYGGFEQYLKGMELID